MPSSTATAPTPTPTTMPPKKADLSELVALLKAYLAYEEPGTTSARSTTQNDIDAALGFSGLIAEEAKEGPWPTWEESPSSSSSTPPLLHLLQVVLDGLPKSTPLNAVACFICAFYQYHSEHNHCVKLDLVWPSTNFASDLKGHLRLEHQEGSSSSLKRAAPPTSDLKRAASPQTSRQLLKHQKGSSSNTKRAAPPASDLKGRLHLKHQEGSFSDLKRAALPQTLRQLLEHQEGNAASDLRPQGASSPRTPRR
ncbi:unnamed protein product [Fusarium graminearum]|uniref:Uncharacterized protein n=1 Tax=Gibberella zeae TaxID=5518 RepID=A0A9N8WVB6_GIBZA|nr:unnamed protein product [Fusarium graminearum]